MYEFISGPLLWFTFTVFIAGCLFRLIQAIALGKNDQIVFPRMGFGKSAGSLAHWLAPYTRLYLGLRPALIIVTIVFHICLVITPIFLLSHILLWNDAWDITWWALPDYLADIMTAIVIVSCAFFFFRRMMLPEVRYVTSFSDYVLLAVTAGPFITGFLAYHQWFNYDTVLIAHVLSGHVLLLAVPFTRLGHMIFLYLTRGYMGSEYGKEANPRTSDALQSAGGPRGLRWD